MSGETDDEDRAIDLFAHQGREKAFRMRPLADRMRPENLDEFIGQETVVGPGSLIHTALTSDRLFSMILWGPPGCGKTTLAHVISKQTKCRFAHFSAVLSGVKDIRNVIAAAREDRNHRGLRTLLFVDEIHRFNKAQQDAFLHHVESGLITLIGATTENPSFEVIPALLSRCQVIVLSAMGEADMALLLRRALADKEKGLGEWGLSCSEDAIRHLINLADGDARAALNLLEITATHLAARVPGAEGSKEIGLSDVETALSRKALSYDKSGEEHYNLISALHKSLRDSDPDAALYWLGRMLSSGENPLYVARRMVRFASEDVGNADPAALTVTMSAMEAYRFLGSPEGDLCLAQAAAYLATAPKSNSIYTAYGEVLQTIRQTGALPVPLHIRNAPTRLMKELGYGKNYKYAHDYKDAFVPQNHLPERLGDRIFYSPTTRGYEKIIKERLDRWRALKKKDNRS